MGVMKVKWNSLLQAIENHLVVPVVGPELGLLKSGEHTQTLYDFVAQELVQMLDWSNTQPPLGSNLETVIRTYLQDPPQ